ncbi:hypothetical protein QQF64_006295 [Cirrhinus molitorella]|uniref:Uncharacterized protein n=1 Tax=Cirrhinus molitorella TaxID=172907 RepID=A0ABR3MEQ7_9TELE
MPLMIPAGLYEALFKVPLYGPQPSGSSPIPDSDLFINEKTLILQRWAKHFQSILNRSSSINDEAIIQLSTGKAPGSDAIPLEVYKAGGAVLGDKLKQMFQSFWYQGSIPQELKDASIVHLYKRKGNRQV